MLDHEGKVALTPHPKSFGNKTENPYIQTDFSESQIEMITPSFDSIEETYRFMEAPGYCVIRARWGILVAKQ